MIGAWAAGRRGGIKRAIGKLSFPDTMVADLVDGGFVELPISAEHADVAPGLPLHHRDPFDRMLIAQALTEQLTIVTADAQFGDYDVELVDAT